MSTSTRLRALQISAATAAAPALAACGDKAPSLATAPASSHTARLDPCAGPSTFACGGQRSSCHLQDECLQRLLQWRQHARATKR